MHLYSLVLEFQIFSETKKTPIIRGVGFIWNSPLLYVIIWSCIGVARQEQLLLDEIHIMFKWGMYSSIRNSANMYRYIFGQNLFFTEYFKFSRKKKGGGKDKEKSSWILWHETGWSCLVQSGDQIVQCALLKSLVF